MPVLLLASKCTAGRYLSWGGGKAVTAAVTTWKTTRCTAAGECFRGAALPCDETGIGGETVSSFCTVREGDAYRRNVTAVAGNVQCSKLYLRVPSKQEAPDVT